MNKKYKGIEYIVHKSELGHYCGYVKLPPKHPWIKILKDEGYDSVPADCHGGVTFGRYFPKKFKEVTKGWWIGWDYAHFGDFMGFAPGLGGKQWTDDEVGHDCFDVIDQLLDCIKK